MLENQGLGRYVYIYIRRSEIMDTSMYHDDVAACCAWKGCSQELSTKGQLLIVSEAPWPVSLAGPTSSKPTPLLVVNSFGVG